MSARLSFLKGKGSPSPRLLWGWGLWCKLMTLNLWHHKMSKFTFSYLSFPFQPHVVLVTTDGTTSTVVNIDPPDEIEKSRSGNPKVR